MVEEPTRKEAGSMPIRPKSCAEQTLQKCHLSRLSKQSDGGLEAEEVKQAASFHDEERQVEREEWRQESTMLRPPPPHNGEADRRIRVWEAIRDTEEDEDEAIANDCAHQVVIDISLRRHPLPIIAGFAPRSVFSVERSRLEF
ncbi:hypothetical protein L2E82_06425 [Cichorium intybus]|uniref:Uncharacterized protein n=1 Tax=Cichorium intybus TaxID=13427 RepID=A0ACB9HB41_CICIN|nr:hypothetical protein L2E82_06425 [Cichorium intybus]